KVARHLVDHGHDGIVVSGTTGESATTTKEEDGEILAAARDAVGADITLVAGVGTNDTTTSIWLAKQAKKVGADGVLLVTPYYNKPGQRGVLHHFRQVIEAAELPVMIYDVPGRTGTQVAYETFVELASEEAVVAIKDATGDLPRGTRLQQLGFAVYSGDDIANLAWLAHGAVGFVSVAGHVVGHGLREMIDVFATNPARAREVYTTMLPAIGAIMGAPNYGATTAKAALELLGVLPNRKVRSPLVPLDDDELFLLHTALVAAGVLGEGR
ncbi:MAG: 4-hydroxy-tetrahydrodipicolinate synthase, partial [Nocardioidaceae bacterium]|nr:4-hydroxy-tetrahydrodipicolinate synthase [Nocardioidaceae bacterium]